MRRQGVLEAPRPRTRFFRSSPIPKERSMTAEYKVLGDVAVITLTNPPVNGLGFSTRVGITDGLSKAIDDPAVKAIVITGAGKAFSGGADIKEFGTPKALQEPNLLSVILALEASHQADRRGDPFGVHGRRPRTGPGLPLPRGRAGHQRRAARGQAGPPARRRRHAAPAARAGRGDRAQHDRQRRGRQERAARVGCPARSCSTSSPHRPNRCSTKRVEFAKSVAGKPADALPLVRNLPCKHPQGDAYFQFAKNMVGGMSKNYPGAAQVRRRRAGRDQDEVRRRHGRRARASSPR